MKPVRCALEFTGVMTHCLHVFAEAPYSMLTLIGIVALGAIVIATIVFVISYVMERRNSHFV